MSYQKAAEDLFNELQREKRDNELLKADNAILKSKWELQGLMIQKLHKEIKELNKEIGGYSGSIQAITEEFNFLLGRLALVNTKMMSGESNEASSNRRNL